MKALSLMMYPIDYTNRSTEYAIYSYIKNGSYW